MVTTKPGYKVNRKDFFDLSDYARPVAVWISLRFKGTKLRAYQVTLFHFALTLLAAHQFYVGGFHNLLIGSGLLILKNILDAVDGSLARVQNRPSRVGRFLDSNLDFIGNFFIFFALVDLSILFRVIGFLFFTFQASFYNYYYIIFRTYNNGEATSQIKEDNRTVYSYDNRTVLNLLYFFYKVFYKWQDLLIDIIERKLVRQKRKSPSAVFISHLSIHGPGFQYLIIILFFLLSTQLAVLIYFSLINLHILVLLFLRSRGKLLV